MATALFPILSEKANTVSAGNKQRVRGLHAVLGVALEKGQVPMKIFSIVNSDAEDGSTNPVPSQSFTWDVYHIENYLLEPRFIFKILKDLGVSLFSSEEDVYAELRECARETLTGLVRHHLATSVRTEIVNSFKTSTDPNAPIVAGALSSAITESAAKISSLVAGKFSLAGLQKNEQELRSDFEKSLAADSWRKRFRGRDILRRFVGRIQKTDYEVFRDLIIASMRDSGFQPEGMRSVVEKILNA